MIDRKILDDLKNKFLTNIPETQFASMRFVKTNDEIIKVRQNILEPVATSHDQGVMFTIIHDNGFGYGATCDLSEKGFKTAIESAFSWAGFTKKYPLIDWTKIVIPQTQGVYLSKSEVPWDNVPLKEKIDLLKTVSEKLKISDLIVDWSVLLYQRTMDSFYVTSKNTEIYQEISQIMPDIEVVANRGSETQKRTLEGMMALSRQGGFEVLDQINLKKAGKQIAEDALALLDAPNCPSGKMDLVLDPNQMLLQIHESIGHPLEIDRILGDERNYAGTSFVTLDMFGKYRYGSDLLNIVFDPTVKGQMATYNFDDEGNEAKKEYLIKNGILQKGLGSNISQQRSAIKGVANSRAMNWNRPPIDRMANINLEPGNSTFDEIISSVENGVYMIANNSWSIDDSRNKFQFGCEKGYLIKNGKITTLVKKPNYRGISESFWRSLKMVGNQDTFRTLGTPSCGKGEPNQVISVGHASPVCLFSNVEVFGGE